MSFIRVTEVQQSGSTIVSSPPTTFKIVVRGLFPTTATSENTYYSKTLTAGVFATINQVEHGLTKIRGITVLTPARAEMEVYAEIRADEEVYIEALTNLNNHILILF